MRDSSSPPVPLTTFQRPVMEKVILFLITWLKSEEIRFDLLDLTKKENAQKIVL